MDKLWTDEGWEDYLLWHKNDNKMLKRIHQLIRDIERDPFNGIGKPEPLKHQASGCWSRRINDEHRLIYAVDNDKLIILRCRKHYGD